MSLHNENSSSLDKASITMQAVCAAKASDQTLNQLDPINQLIHTLLPKADEYRSAMDKYSGGMFTPTVCARKKFFADFLNDNAHEFSQLIILCGGLDFSSLSNEKWQSKPKFFIDHPLSLELSLSLLKKASVNTQSMSFIGVDLADENASKNLEMILSDHGFDPKKSTLIVWEGATYYIKEKKVLSILESLTRLIQNLKISFDFVLKNPEFIPVPNEIDDLNNSLSYVKKHNEPWQSKFLVNDLKVNLLKFQFQAIDFKSDIEVMAQYAPNLKNYLNMFGFAVAQK